MELMLFSHTTIPENPVLHFDLEFNPFLLQGPVLGWIHALQSYREIGLEFPVNFKFCFEGMEESGSEGLDTMLMSRQDTKFMQEVDYCCISDNYWLGKNKPCITYGLRGVCYFFIEVIILTVLRMQL